MVNAKSVWALYRIFLFDTEYATVQTAKQSCELLLKVQFCLGDLFLRADLCPSKIIDSILDYSKLEASGNCFSPLYPEQQAQIPQISPQARSHRLLHRRPHSCEFRCPSRYYKRHAETL